MIADEIEKIIREAARNLSLDVSDIETDHPGDLAHGDYSTNVAFVAASKLNRNPKEVARDIVKNIEASKFPWLSKVEVAGPGFVNFHLSGDFFGGEVGKALDLGDSWGSNETLSGKKMLVEYTDANPFKEFHIGHLMSNSIGESISRLMEFSGAEVRRANYQGDVGVHVAKAIWGIKRSPDSLLSVAGLGSAYALGARAYEDDEEAKREIDEINEKLYNHSDRELEDLYKKGKETSLAYFESIYKLLGTKFDFYFFESEVGETGKKIVEDNKDIFEESDGAVVFRGDKHGLHTRVFISNRGFPLYEAKELGLIKIKYEKYPFDVSVVVTANEIVDYFKVVLEAARKIIPDLADKTIHVAHGKLRLSSGKMSSRKGDVLTGMWLIDEVKRRIASRLSKGESASGSSGENKVAVGAVKYSMLKQSAGKDIVFDFERSLSVEGDSGPYLQYAHTRALSLLKKANDTKQSSEVNASLPGGWNTTALERELYKFPQVVQRAAEEYEPHYVTTYLTNLAGIFNAYYAGEKIIGSHEEKYKLSLVNAFEITMKNGLWLLGIEAPERM